MKQGKLAQIKKMRHQRANQRFTEKKYLPEFNYDEFAGFLRARYFLTRRNKFDTKTFEIASFFLDDVITTMVQQNFSQFTSNQRAIVNINEVMQATIVNSVDRDWRYFILLFPVLYDMQQFFAKEGNVNDRYGIQSTNYDPNFWRMIIRTVLALNYFRFQGKDVADLMKNSSAIDDLQFKFLKPNGDDDDFDLATIEEIYRGIKVQMLPLQDADSAVSADKLTAEALAEERQYADKRIGQFQADSIKGVVSENVINLLMAFQVGISEKYNLTHESWTPAVIKTFTTHNLSEYWQPIWDNLNGIGSEFSGYITFLGKKKAINASQKIIKGLSGLGHYIDVWALNYLLAQIDMVELTKLSK